MILGDDLQLQCDEEIMGECTVEVKDIHIQGEQKNIKRETKKNHLNVDCNSEVNKDEQATAKYMYR